MATFEYRLAFHQPKSGAAALDLPAAPAPVYVMATPYLTASDFVGASLIEGTLSARLTPGGREKINEIGNTNAAAKRLEDYVGLLLYLNGKPEKTYTLVCEPLPGYDLEVRGMDAERLRSLASAIGAARAL